METDETKKKGSTREKEQVPEGFTKTMRSHREFDADMFRLRTIMVNGVRMIEVARKDGTWMERFAFNTIQYTTLVYLIDNKDSDAITNLCMLHHFCTTISDAYVIREFFEVIERYMGRVGGKQSEADSDDVPDTTEEEALMEGIADKIGDGVEEEACKKGWFRRIFGL